MEGNVKINDYECVIKFNVAICGRLDITEIRHRGEEITGLVSEELIKLITLEDIDY